LELENRKQKSKAMEIYKCIAKTIITHSSHTFLEKKSEIVDDDNDDDAAASGGEKKIVLACRLGLLHKAVQNFTS
jgi:hypothetical protein